MQWCKQKFTELVILAVGLAILVAALLLPPGAGGWGEGGRWHLPLCSFKTVTGWLWGCQLPCITCGFTHTFSYAAHGRFLDAFREQPAGLVTFLGMLALMFNAGWSVAKGEPYWSLDRRRKRWLIALYVMILLVAWLYKLSQAWH